MPPANDALAADAPILICGPTASGKSGLALALAERLGGLVINADALQVYRDWRILTARPEPDATTRAPHRLYGRLALTESYSVGLWLRDAAAAMTEARAAGLRPILAGGTGLYFKALTEGLAEIPPPTADIRAEAEARLAALGRAAFAAEIAARDPATAAAIDLANPARLLRAWEVLETTGEGLAALWARTPPPLLTNAVRLLVAPPREKLYARCDARFDAMLAAGALEEAEAVAAAAPPADAPGLKALGARELIAHVEGRMALADAATAAKQATRNYAKRQLTWARSRMSDWTWIEAPDPDSVAQSDLQTKPSPADPA